MKYSVPVAQVCELTSTVSLSCMHSGHNAKTACYSAVGGARIHILIGLDHVLPSRGSEVATQAGKNLVQSASIEQKKA